MNLFSPPLLKKPDGADRARQETDIHGRPRGTQPSGSFHAGGWGGWKNRKGKLPFPPSSSTSGFGAGRRSVRSPRSDVSSAAWEEETARGRAFKGTRRPKPLAFFSVAQPHLSWTSGRITAPPTCSVTLLFLFLMKGGRFYNLNISNINIKFKG